MHKKLLRYFFSRMKVKLLRLLSPKDFSIQATDMLVHSSVCVNISTFISAASSSYAVIAKPLTDVISMIGLVSMMMMTTSQIQQ